MALAAGLKAPWPTSFAATYEEMSKKGSAKEKKAASVYLDADQELRDEEESCVETAEKAVKLFREAGNDKAVHDALRLLVNAHRQAADVPNGLPDEAQALAENELAGYKRSEDKRGEGSMLLCVALCKLDRVVQKNDLKNLDEALDEAREALRIFREDAEDKGMEGLALCALCDFYMLKEWREEMKEAAEQATSIFEDLEDKQGELNGLHAEATSHEMGYELDKALKISNKVASIIKDMGSAKTEGWHKFTLATWLLRECKPKKALPLAREALRILRGVENSKGWDRIALRLVVDSQIAAKNGKAAVKTAKDAKKYYIDKDDRKGHIFSLGCLSEALTASKSFTEAQNTADEAIDMVREDGDKRWEATLLCSKAQSHLQDDDTETALGFYNEAAEMMNDLGDKREAASIMNSIAEISIQKGDTRNAMAKAGEARTLAQEQGDEQREVAALVNTAIALGGQGELEKALKTAKEALELAQDGEFERGEAQALRLIGQIYCILGKYGKALDAADESREIWEDLGEVRLEADACIEVSKVFIADQNWSDAVDELGEALKLYRQVDDKVGEVNGLLMLAQAHIGQLQEDQVEPPAGKTSESYRLALKAVGDALTRTKNLGNKDARGWALLWYGQVVTWDFKLSTSEKLATEALEQFEASENKAGQGNALVLQGQLAFVAKKKEEAMSLAEKALEIFREVQDPEGEEVVQDLIQQIEAADKSKDAQAAALQAQLAMLAQGDAGGAVQQAAAESAVAAPAKPKGLNPAMVAKKVMETIKNSLTADEEDIGSDSALMEAGMDSLSSVELMTTLSREFQMNFAPSLVFDFPTGRALTDHIVEQSMEMA